MRKQSFGQGFGIQMAAGEDPCCLQLPDIVQRGLHAMSSVSASFHDLVPIALQVFIVDTRAGKRQIKEAVQKMYDIQAARINTLSR